MKYIGMEMTAASQNIEIKVYAWANALCLNMQIWWLRHCFPEIFAWENLGAQVVNATLYIPMI